MTKLTNKQKLSAAIKYIEAVRADLYPLIPRPFKKFLDILTDDTTGNLYVLMDIAEYYASLKNK